MASGNTQVKSMTYSSKRNRQQERAIERRRQFTPRKRTSESEDDGTCDLCVQSIKVYAIGYCDHPICYRCSAKMRILCGQNHCSVCRVEMKKIIYCKSKRPFIEANALQLIRHNKYNVFFTDDIVKKEYEKLLEHACPVCPNHPPEMSFEMLEAHVRKEHKLFYCQLCVRHNTNFTDECKTYTREGLAKHRRVGDDDDTSHKGHPLCEFCDERYLDNDTLLQHLRKDHYFCHFCDQEGRNQYYDDYVDLRQHYRKEHFLCEEGDCINEQFTSVFASELDLKAHRAAAHNQGLSRQQQKVERNIDLGFQYVKRPTRGGGRGYRNEGGTGGGTGRGRGRGNNSTRDDDLELAKALSLAEQQSAKNGPEKSNDKRGDRPRVQREQPQRQPREEESPPPDLMNDFPSLGASEPEKPSDPYSYPTVRKEPQKQEEKPSDEPKKPSEPTAAYKIAAASGRSMGKITQEDFPTLGSANKPSASQLSGIWGTPSAPVQSTKQAPAKVSKPVSVNVPQSKFSKSKVDLKNNEEFPTLGGGSMLAQAQSPGIWGPFTPAPTKTRKSKKPKTPIASQPVVKKQSAPKITTPNPAPPVHDPNPMSHDEVVSIRIGSHKHTMRLTSAKHNEEISDIEKPVEVPGVGGSTVKTVSADAFSMLSKRSSQPQQQHNLSESKFAPQMSDFPELGGAKGGRIRGIGTTNASWVQNNSAKNGKNSKKFSLSDLSKDIASNDNLPPKNNNSATFPSSEDDFPQITKPPPLSSYSANWHEDSQLSVADTVIKERSFNAQESDFPTLSTQASKNSQPSGKRNKKKKKKNQPNVSDLSKHFGSVAIESSQNGSHLESLLQSQKTDAQLSLTAMLDKDDMFGPVKDHEKEIVPNGNARNAKEIEHKVESDDMEPEDVLHERPDEDDIQGRNIWLITTIQQLCGNEENFSEFKSASGSFRQGTMPAKRYYEKCKILLGKKHFDVVFRELVDLLPDSDKQEALMAVHAAW